MKRGDVVTVALSGDYGKPRPAVIIQTDNLAKTDSVLVCLVTSHERDAFLYRVDIKPDEANGLRAPSQIMADKIIAAPRAKCGKRIDQIDDATMQNLNEVLALVIGLAD